MLLDALVERQTAVRELYRVDDFGQFVPVLRCGLDQGIHLVLGSRENDGGSLDLSVAVEEAFESQGIDLDARAESDNVVYPGDVVYSWGSIIRNTNE